MEERRLICSSCRKEQGVLAKDLPCEVLSGWLTVCQWEGLGAVKHYNLCSFTCLKRWVETQVPRIPKVFLEAIGDEDANL